MFAKRESVLKLMMTVVAMFTLTVSISATKPLSLYFSPYYDIDSGKVGVQYGEDLCVLPKYDDVDFTRIPSIYCTDYRKNNIAMSPYNTKDGYFAYKEGDKWGIACIYGIITKPKFDRVRFLLNSSFAVVRNAGKEGLVYCGENEIMPCKFDSIACRIDIMDSQWYWDFDKHPLSKSNHYFLAYDNGYAKVIDVLGNIVADNYDDSKILTKNLEARKKEFKKLVSLEDKRGKKTPQIISELDEKLKSKIFHKGCSAVIGGKTIGCSFFKDIDNDKFLILKDRMWKLPSEYDYEPFLIKPNEQFEYKNVVNPLNNTVFKIYKDGKCGVMDITGKIIIPVEYNIIELSAHQTFFDVARNGLKGRFSVEGDELIPCAFEFIGFENVGDYVSVTCAMKGKEKHYYCDNKLLSVGNKKEARKKYYQVVNSDEAKTRENSIKEFRKALVSAVPVFEPACYPHKNGEYESSMTDNGTDLTPLAKCSSSEIEKRNGSPSYVAIARDLYEKRDRTLPDDFKDLYALAAIGEVSGFGDSDYVKMLTDLADALSNLYTESERKRIEQEESQARLARLNAMIDGISSSILNVIDTGINIYSSTKKDSASEYDSSAGDSSSSHKSGGVIPNKYNLSEQQAYNSDKATYGKYDSMVAAALAGNRPAKASEISEWQKKMKKLREKWEDKGKLFPHSENEGR